MTRLRGWCSCGGPLWREQWHPLTSESWVTCRLCDLEVRGSERWSSRGGVYDLAALNAYATLRTMTANLWHDRRDEANDTANSPARSTWLPPGANDPTNVRGGTMAIASQIYGVSFAVAGNARRRRNHQPR